MISVPPSPLSRAVTDQKIAVLVLDEGEPCASLLVGIAATMTLVQAASGKRKPKGLQPALLTCLSQVKRNAFQRHTATQILKGLDICLRVAPTLPQGAIAKAIGASK